MPPNEQTPLLTSVVITPRRQRYSHSTLRRFCTISLGAILVVVVILFLLPVSWLPPRNTSGEHDGWTFPGTSPLPHKSWPESKGLSYNDLQNILLNTPSEAKAREWSQYYTAGPHLAGKNLTQALWTRQRWQGFGIQDSNIVAYDVFINYPLGHRLALLESSSQGADDSTVAKASTSAYRVKYECKLKEDILDEDPTTGLEDRIPTFHGYSANGNVTAQYVYVNFGTFGDFEDLVKADIPLEGKIAIVKYGRVFRGLKVKRAQELGMVGVVMYSDPQEDGEVTEENGYETYPNGPARNPSSVQRGSTQFLSTIERSHIILNCMLTALQGFAPGDPTTIGYPSKPGVPRQNVSGVIPSIPSIPISYVDALPILRSLNGHGPRASSFNEFWQGGGLGYKNVSYNIGPSPPFLQINLVNEQDYVTTPLWNVIGIINGTVPDEVVVIGNHRDAWIAGGAADPNSGSAALNELVRSFGIAVGKGWKPLRTIVFASWDGEEYGLIGSTEWVEEYIPWLSGAAIAYLNVDVGCAGPHFSSAASPLLNKAIYEATSLVLSPNQTVPGQTVRDIWEGHIRTMGSGSDFTAFQDFAGVPSLDMGFRGTAKGAIYHYHSNYDSFYWMDTFGDRDWHYHVTITRVWAVLALSLIERPIISFNATDYAHGLAAYLDSVKARAANSSLSGSTVSFQPLEVAIARLTKATEEFDAKAATLSGRIRHAKFSWWQWWQKPRLYSEVQTINEGYKYLERQFLYPKGLDGRSCFKHVVFAPGKWTGYSGATFPGLVEGLDEENPDGVKRERILSKMN
ncbi:MAG: hypothetical protein LQ351_006822 [Letrouitia transgressa]|nr:MAG: hypothetical protein LQ351_006822 [Letrouitia transgressa]